MREDGDPPRRGNRFGRANSRGEEPLPTSVLQAHYDSLKAKDQYLMDDLAFQQGRMEQRWPDEADQRHALFSQEQMMQRIQELESSHQALKNQMTEILSIKKNLEKQLAARDAGSVPSVPLESELSDEQIALRSLGVQLGSGDWEFEFRQQQREYRDVLQKLGQAIYCFKFTGEITYWNHNSEMLFGYTAEEAIGCNIVELLCMESLYEVAAQIISRLKAGQSWTGTFPLRKKSGEVFSAMITNSPLFDSESKLCGIIGITCDSRPLKVRTNRGSSSSNALALNPASNRSSSVAPSSPHSETAEGFPNPSDNAQQLRFSLSSIFSSLAGKVMQRWSSGHSSSDSEGGSSGSQGSSSSESMDLIDGKKNSEKGKQILSIEKDDYKLDTSKSTPKTKNLPIELPGVPGVFRYVEFPKQPPSSSSQRVLRDSLISRYSSNDQISIADVRRNIPTFYVNDPLNLHDPRRAIHFSSASLIDSEKLRHSYPMHPSLISERRNLYLNQFPHPNPEIHTKFIQNESNFRMEQNHHLYRTDLPLPTLIKPSYTTSDQQQLKFREFTNEFGQLVIESVKADEHFPKSSFGSPSLVRESQHGSQSTESEMNSYHWEEDGSERNNERLSNDDEEELSWEIDWNEIELGKLIGQGSCGSVYHGIWNGSDVAVKVFLTSEFRSELVEDFRKEVFIMQKLRHPNILLFMGAITSEERMCIVTEYLPRGSLFRLIHRNTESLVWERCLRMALDIARGVNYLHKSNPPIIHRDLKSSNLMVDKNWTVKVGDFGLSKLKHETMVSALSGRGTPQWMAPEILRNESANEKADVYSFGVILWELVTKKIPWEELNPMQVVGAVGFMDKRLPIPEDTPSVIKRMIEQCWNSDPFSRPSMDDIVSEIRQMISNSTSLTASSSNDVPPQAPPPS